MSTSAIDVVARAAAETASRRKSILAMGMAVLAAGAANAGVTEAKKKKGKDCKKKEKQRCANDAAACKVSLAPVCQGADPADCIALQNCCDSCSSNEFLTCLILAQASVEAFA
jgi:hypothetical protein